MPTLSGLRRRGFTPEAIRTFVAAAGVSRTNGITDIEMLEHFQRDDLNRRARRAMAVLHPLKLVIDNYPAGQEEFVEVANNPEDPSAGTRQVPFSARDLHRAGRLPRSSSAQVLPPLSRQRSPPAQRLLRHRPERGERRGRQHRRGALHLRSGQPRRQLARRPQGQVHHALGLGRPRHLRRNPPLRQALHQARSLRLRRRPGASSTISTPTRSRSSPAPSWSPLSPTPSWKTASSSSASATSASIPTPLRAIWSSTAPSRSKTPGPRSRRRPGTSPEPKIPSRSAEVKCRADSPRKTPQPKTPQSRISAAIQSCPQGLGFSSRKPRAQQSRE